MTNLKEYIGLFKELKKLKITQFESLISSSQYLLAYDLILKYSPSEAKILDWGTGTGHFSLFLLKNKFRVTGFSIEQGFALARELSESFPDHYNCISNPNAVKYLPFSDSSFDVVTSIGVLEHVRETGGTENDSLSEIYRVLKPGGIFICFHLPNKYSWIEAISKRLTHKYHHRFKYSVTDVNCLFEDMALEITDTRRYGFLPRLMFRSLPDSILITKLYNRTDRILSRLFSFVSQNHYMVAKKSS